MRKLPKGAASGGDSAAKPSRFSLSASPRAMAVVFLCGAAAYVVGFLLSAEHRRAALLLLFIPDAVVMEWFGGDPARFGLWDRVPVLLVTALILAVGLLGGRLLLDLVRVDRLLSRGEQFVFAAGLGMNGLSLLTLVMGLAGQLHRGWLYLLAAVVLALAIVRFRHWRATSLPPDGIPADTGVRAALIAALPLVILIMLGGMLPPWYFDVREYHLQIPKEWFQHGRIGFVPHNVYGNMPQGAGMPALMGMVLTAQAPAWWWGALAGKTVIAACAPLTALAIYVFGRRFVTAKVGAVAALVFLTTPWVGHVSMAGLIDVVSALYCLLAVHAGWLWTKYQRTGQGGHAARWGLPIIAGFLAGGGVACKYPAVVFLVAPLLFVFLVVPPGRPHGRAAMVFLLGVAIGCGPWLGKNWVLAGNPTYPLLYEWFDGQTWTPEKDARWKRAHQAGHRTGEQPFGLSQLRRDLTIVGWSSSYASPVLVPFFIVGLFCRRHRALVASLAAFCLFVLVAWWLLTHRVDRFLIPILPLAAIVAAVGASWSPWIVWRRAVWVLLTVAVGYGALLAGSRLAGDNRFLVALRDLRTDLAHPRDPDYWHLHPAHHFLNQNVADGYRVLAVGEAQVFNFAVPVLYNTCFDDCVLEQLLRGRTREERYAALRAEQISHVFVFWRELDRYRSPGNYGYSDFVTRDLVRRVLVEEQKLLRPIPSIDHPESSEVFEVIGWQDW